MKIDLEGKRYKKTAQLFFYRRAVVTWPVMCLAVIFIANVLGSIFGVPNVLIEYGWSAGFRGLREAGVMNDVRYIWCYLVTFYFAIPFFIFSLCVSISERLNNHNLDSKGAIKLGLKVSLFFLVMVFCEIFQIAKVIYFDYGWIKWIYSEFYAFASFRASLLFLMGFSLYLTVIGWKVFFWGLKERRRK